MALSQAEEKAKQALIDEAGCVGPRAEALVIALNQAAGDEALEVVSGDAQVYGSVVDTRVVRLSRIIEALPAGSELPSRYEIGVIFRITVEQAGNVLRTYQARFAQTYRLRMEKELWHVEATAEEKDGAKIYVFEFTDPAVLDYAVERLNRRGLSRSLAVDRTKLTLSVDRDEKDRHGQDAAKVLEGAP